MKYVPTKLFTIKDLRNGNVSVYNDGTLEELSRVLRIAFPLSIYETKGYSNFYFRDPIGNYTESSYSDLPYQSVKIFIQELDAPPKKIKKVENKKEETKLWLSKVINRLEDSLTYIEQDEGNSGLSEHEKKGLKVEKKQTMKELTDAKKCLKWVKSL